MQFHINSGKHMLDVPLWGRCYVSSTVIYRVYEDEHWAEDKFILLSEGHWVCLLIAVYQLWKDRMWYVLAYTVKSPLSH